MIRSRTKYLRVATTRFAWLLNPQENGHNRCCHPARLPLPLIRKCTRFSLAVAAVRAHAETQRTAWFDRRSVLPLLILNRSKRVQELPSREILRLE
jgi:hypothetical protein